MESSIASYETLLTCEKIPKKVLSIDKIDSDGIFFFFVNMYNYYSEKCTNYRKEKNLWAKAEHLYQENVCLLIYRNT